ncbi:MAG: glycerophosphodiester phosphodiesterase, partial [Actinobacteria bacterium]
MQVIGHRGAAALGPENTIAAVEAGLAAGADGVEIDVRRTADGVVVLMHDA